MSLSVHRALVPGVVGTFKALAAILDKAEAFAESKKIDPAVLVNARLAPDMHPLSRQIQIASDTAKGGGARLAQVEVPSYPDTEVTFAELKERIAKTVAFLEGLDPADFEGAEGRTVTLKLGPNDVAFAAPDYLFGFVIPNVYFHVMAAYAILRHNGVEIGKRDFLGEIPRS